MVVEEKRGRLIVETQLERFGRWVREAREAVGLNQTELAALLKRSRGTVSNLETGKPPDRKAPKDDPTHITPQFIKQIVRVLRERGSVVTETEGYEALGILPAGPVQRETLALPAGEFPNPRPVVVRDEAYEPYALPGQVVWVCRAEDLSEEQREDLPAVVAIDGERRVLVYRGRGRDSQGRPAYQFEDGTGTFYVPRDQVALEEFIVVIGELAKQGMG